MHQIQTMEMTAPFVGIYYCCNGSVKYQYCYTTLTKQSYSNRAIIQVIICAYMGIHEINFTNS